MFMGMVRCWLSFSQVMSSSGPVQFVSNILKEFLLVTVSCILALIGAVVGCITGAVIGQTSETGILRGCGMGTLSGSLAALELVESIVNHNFLSKVEISGGVANGEVLSDWLAQILLKAYDFQVNNMQEQPSMSDLSDIFDMETGVKGLSLEHLRNLPTFTVSSKQIPCGEDDEVSCPICLEKLGEGECGRKLSGCRHEFHLQCIDTWLVRRGSCPVCRQEITA